MSEFFKSVNIWQSYKQERGCLMHFARLANTLLKDEESARDNHVFVYNFAKYSPILIFFTIRLSNKPFLIWLLKTPTHLKYVNANLPQNLPVKKIVNRLRFDIMVMSLWPRFWPTL